MNRPQNEDELLRRANALAGATMADIAAGCGVDLPTGLRRAKGFVGELLEQVLGADAGSKPVPDFGHLGIELKTIPLNARQEPKESTFVCSAPVKNLAGSQWESSTVCAKLSHVLWIPVESDPSLPIGERRVGSPILWRPSDDDAAVLRADWEEHIETISLGKLHELDARRGTYLQLRPKALNKTDKTLSYDEYGVPAYVTHRGFYLRTAFTRKIIATC